ncbi:arsenate reductase (glutaredoxin) [Marinibaculum pumilum]|uniref:Arsenate reductase n=1 Tax=Marinibaculum pumilum TaxID=1766165 RepID=A0ABV7L7J6_9PROT
MKVTIYHNPRCSKSRQCLQLLRDRGIEPEVVEYLKTPPSAAELDSLLKLMDLEPRAAMRRKEPPYKARDLDDPALDRKALLAAMVADPVLIERPIVVVDRNGKRSARMGRPPEAVLEILPA